ncbi:unnamed protein product [Peronospora belbahrii]|uniref:Integrase catalytic domain-containing protein n=1 Tax=Peronospora belbahrii TaxID=622444 RepID=A0ABN8CR32_9STRA|nr:unnamed protein product [Peronospora belbahrii]
MWGHVWIARPGKEDQICSARLQEMSKQHTPYRLSRWIIFRSHRVNTELLIWVDVFTGYVMAKSSASRAAQTISEGYEECVFHRFGASEAICHDREPGFLSDVFRAFRRMVGQRQQATIAYRPQANRTAQKLVR